MHRTLASIFLFGLLTASTYAQVSVSEQNESQRMKSILNPTLNPATGLQDKSFYSGADKGVNAKPAYVKSFFWSSLFKPKSFEGTKKFSSDSYWTGEFVQGVEKARTKGDYEIPNSTEKYRTKTNPVKEDRDAGKKQEVRAYDKNRPYLIEGKSQKILDSQQAAQKPLTVDDVRTILNTTK